MTDFPRPDWDALYAVHFPQDTCGASRHAAMIAGNIRDVPDIWAVMEIHGEADHIAASIEDTVIALWDARSKLRKAKEAGQ